MFLFLGNLLIMAHYYPQMPRRMASHFAADGHVNGWQSRDAFFVLMLLVSSASAVVCFLAPRQIAAKANTRINLPNREYWLAPQRREATMRFISATMAWFGCGILFVLIFGTFLALQANLSPDHRFSSEAMVLVLVSFLAGLLGLLVRLVRHFQRVPPGV
jgi:serine/threonine-protein kinase